MQPRILLSALLALLPLSAAPVAQDPPKLKIAGYLTPDILKDEIGLSLDWLRTRQDPTTGAYGDVQITSLVLVAFAESPWKYSTDSGPFVSKAVDYLLASQRPDGAICAADANPLTEKVHTNAAQEALAFFSDPVVKAALARSREFVTRPGLGNASWSSTLAGVSSAQLLQLAEDTLWTRQRQGYWEHPFSRVRATAVNVGRLNGHHIVLESRRPPPMMEPDRPLPAFGAVGFKLSDEARARGAAFLLAAAENGRWGFPGQADPGITAMVTGALLATPEPRSAAVTKAVGIALDWLLSLQKDDGSIHAGQLKNYVTSASILALSKAGREQDKPAIARARAFLQRLQDDEGEGLTPSDAEYGGVGYGGDGRPDLSNLQMALEALSAAGVKQGDPTFQKALTFLQRCQNRSESNDLRITVDGVTTRSGEDGGAGYGPLDSKAGYVELSDGTRVPRSYGSMTYALLKAYLFAGVEKSDPRVEAAWTWLRENYTLDVNPGFEASKDPSAAYQGLFYYFYTMARALDLYGQEAVVDSTGQSHAWRHELVARVAAMQRQDGSWINDNAERWYEGYPVLATSYALMTLEIATPDVR